MHKAGLLIYLRAHLISIGLLLIIGFYLINGVCYLSAQSITSDEGSFYTYAVRYLKGNPARITPVSDNSKMPIAALNTMPRLAERLFNPTTKKTDGGVSDIMHGRYVTLLISTLTIFLVFMWSSELYGKKAGLFCALLMSICPNHLANTGLVTTDAYSVLFLLAVMYCLWKFCTTRSNRYFILLSIVVAMSQLVKQSLFHVYILIPICLVVYFSANPVTIKFKSFFQKLIIFLLINWLVINLAWYFYQSFWTLREFYFLSNLFRGIQRLLPGWLPVPFPKPFIDGLDLAKYYDHLGGGYDPDSAFGNVTIMGHFKTGGGYWYYYFVSMFYKTPISYFVLLVLTMAELFRKSSVKQFISKEFFLFAPVVYFLITLSFFYQTQTGLRHMIFIYPFLFIAM